jgi:hypothetical protein
VMLDVVQRLVERRLPELVMAGITEHQEVSHAPATLGCLPRRCTDAGFPADLGHAGPQLMAKRAVLLLVIEQRYRHKMIMPRLTSFSRARSQTCSSRVQQPHRTVLTPCDRHRPLACVNGLYRPLCP